MVLAAYGADTFVFGPDYILPKPFDPRLILEIAPPVARAAMDTGVATRPITDFEAYRERLSRFVYRSGFVMKPVFDTAKSEHLKEPKRLVFAEGEHPYVLQAAQQVIMEKLARPILVGRRDVIKRMLGHLGIRLKIDQDFEVFDQDTDSRVPAMTQEYERLVERQGVSPSHARRIVRGGSTVTAGMLLKRGDADAMICGAVGRYHTQLRHVTQVIGMKGGVRGFATVSGLILPTGPLFMADTYVSYDPEPNISPRSRCWPPTRSAASAWSRRSRCCRTRISAPRAPVRRTRCATCWRRCTPGRPISKWKARCTRTRRCRRSSATRSFLIRD